MLLFILSRRRAGHQVQRRRAAADCAAGAGAAGQDTAGARRGKAAHSVLCGCSLVLFRLPFSLWPASLFGSQTRFPHPECNTPCPVPLLPSSLWRRCPQARCHAAWLRMQPSRWGASHGCAPSPWRRMHTSSWGPGALLLFCPMSGTSSLLHLVGVLHCICFAGTCSAAVCLYLSDAISAPSLPRQVCCAARHPGRH